MTDIKTVGESVETKKDPDEWYYEMITALTAQHLEEFGGYEYPSAMVRNVFVYTEIDSDEEHSTIHAYTKPTMHKWYKRAKALMKGHPNIDDLYSGLMETMQAKDDIAKTY